MHPCLLSIGGKMRKVQIIKSGKLYIILCFLFFTFLAGCGYHATPSQNVEQKSTGDYITATVTGYDNGTNADDGMTCQIWCYDINTDTSTEIFDFKATAQYSLGYYDRSAQKVYYVERVEDQSPDGYGDQIMMSDLSSHKETQLTDSFFAVNYLIPIADRLYFVASVQGDRTDRLGFIDLTTGDIQFWKKDGDTVVDGVTIDKKSKKIYATAYSISERDYNVVHQGNGNYLIPLYTVYEINMDLTSSTALYSQHRWLRSVMTCENSIEILCDEKYNRPEIPTTIYNLDLSTKKLSSRLWDAPRLEGRNPNYSSDGMSIFSIVTMEDGKRGIGKYDCKSKETTLCVDTAAGNFLNNIYLVREDETC